MPLEKKCFIVYFKQKVFFALKIFFLTLVSLFLEKRPFLIWVCFYLVSVKKKQHRTCVFTYLDMIFVLMACFMSQVSLNSDIERPLCFVCCLISLWCMFFTLYINDTLTIKLGGRFFHDFLYWLFLLYNVWVISLGVVVSDVLMQCFVIVCQKRKM